MILPKLEPRRPFTAFAIGDSKTNGDRIFVDYLIPGGQTIRALDGDVFREAVKRGGLVLRELSEKYKSLNGENLGLSDDRSSSGRGRGR